MQLYAEQDIEVSVRELEFALGGLFRKERIEHLRKRVADLEAQHKNAAIARHQLVLAMADQIRWELAA